MSLWWLQPGWKSARCSCGANIWGAGGDPDMGQCPECFDADWDRRHPPEPEPPEPTPEELCGPQHEYHGDDEQGPRCYCGAVRAWPIVPLTTTGGDGGEKQGGGK